jgi:dihydrofolate synthase/folylpolyglutamate synthase
MKIANFTDAHAQLRQFYNVVADYKLDTMRQFMAFLGNPQNDLKIIHVAGTSGKTSTSYYAAALLKAAGYTVGLTVSPHVDEVNERVQINMQPLSEAEFCEALGEFLELVTASTLSLSYFEVMVGFAYWYFAKANVDYAVVEVGLGGRIDGTNVVSRSDKICIITTIGLDHTKILGDTVEQIAAEKAGIITPKNDVYTYRQDQTILEVFEQKCHEERATLHVVNPVSDDALADLPLFQQRNFQLAAAAVREALKRERKILNKLSILEAAHTYIPARMEKIQQGNQTIIIDGAHNGQKLSTLLESVDNQYTGQEIAALVAFVSGDERRMHEGLDALRQRIDYMIITEFTTEQDVPKSSVPASDITSYLQAHNYHNFEVITRPANALQRLLERPEPVLAVTGSFYLLNHVRPQLLQKRSVIQ